MIKQYRGSQRHIYQTLYNIDSNHYVVEYVPSWEPRGSKVRQGTVLRPQSEKASPPPVVESSLENGGVNAMSQSPVFKQAEIERLIVLSPIPDHSPRFPILMMGNFGLHGLMPHSVFSTATWAESPVLAGVLGIEIRDHGSA